MKKSLQSTLKITAQERNGYLNAQIKSTGNILYLLVGIAQFLEESINKTEVTDSEVFNILTQSIDEIRKGEK